MELAPSLPQIESLEQNCLEDICCYGDLRVVRSSEPDIATNLAIDEYLAKDAAATGGRTLRLWWGDTPALVLGCGDKPEAVLDLEECVARKVGWIKRITGGGTVLQSGGILNYSYTAPDPGGLDIKRTFESGAQFIIAGLAEFGIDGCYRGISDVAVRELKISGNAQARKWRSILLHGTVLVDLDFDLLAAVLKHPAREPDYRRGRNHRDFLTTMRNLHVSADKDTIEQAFVRCAGVFGQ
ncbi:MAG: lipoate--protein ligase family protein [Armatimonadota bacterium]